MLNAFCKSMLAGSLSIMILSGCSDNSKAARELLSQAESMAVSGDYPGALALLDSVDSRYAAEVEVRRDAMSLRPRIMEMLTLKELSTADSMIVQLTIEADAVKDVMDFVEDSFEGYYTTKALKGKVPAEKPGLYARMSADGIYTVVSSCPKGTESTAVGLKSGDDEVMSARVAHDGERNDRSRGVEIINFMPSECDTLGVFAERHTGGEIKATFFGEKKNHTMTLPKDQAEALGSVHKASVIVGRLHKAQLEKTRLERQLDVARSQMARTFREKE